MQLDHLAQYFKQDELSDVTLIIKLRKTEAETEDDERDTKRARLDTDSPSAAGGDQILAQFPAHRLVLIGTDYFKTQVSYAVKQLPRRL
jgi:hypothetical protein